MLVGSWVNVGNILLCEKNIEASPFDYLQPEVLLAF